MYYSYLNHLIVKIWIKSMFQVKFYFRDMATVRFEFNQKTQRLVIITLKYYINVLN